MGKRICVLLNGPIVSDSRVIKEITTMSQFADVDLFYIEGKDTDNEVFGCNVRLFNCYKPSGFFSKLIRHTCFYNEFMFFVDEVMKRKVDYDYVWANDLPDLKPALRIKKYINAKVIYDSHEIYIATLNQFFPSKAVWYKSIMYRSALHTMSLLGSIAEKRMVKRVDEFVTPCISLKKYFQEKYKLDNIKVVMNCPRTQFSTDYFDFRNNYNLAEDSFVLIFQGRLNAGRALMEMIESMLYVTEKVHLFVIGDGTLKNDMIQRTNELSLNDRIHFVDEVPSSVLLTYTRGADAGINLQTSINISKYFASANKLFEYTHSGIPTIGSDVPENRLIINKYNLGILVNNRPEEIAIAINDISKKDLLVYKENCYKAAKEYCWENQEPVILELIQ